MPAYIMALDQGTSSSRCILFTPDGRIASSAAREFPSLYPREGWVEQDPMTIWSSQLSVASEAVSRIGAQWSEIAGIGITNQRETVLVWERSTGRPIHNAIVWQCRRTADMCELLKKQGCEKTIKEKTGLLLDPYFSATKLRYILDTVDGAQERAERGELCFGTVDSWLMWQLSGGKIHATDYSNASRTMLFDIRRCDWDPELLSLFRIPRAILPALCPSSGLFGYTDPAVLGARLPIGGVAGDQQAALFGQCCFAPGQIKNTYGTGGFLLMNTGDAPCITYNGLISTVAWGIGEKICYALEGSVFVAGAAIQWLRDGLRLIESAADSEYMAAKVPDSGGLFVVPAFTGLGAPYWDTDARGMIIGITRATNKYHLIRATLESLAYQTADVIELMERSVQTKIDGLRVDGGAAQNQLLLQFQSDLLGVPLYRPACIETTALGAAYLCGLAVGVYSSEDELRTSRQEDDCFRPAQDAAWRDAHLHGWRRAVRRALGFAAPDPEP